MQKTKTLHLLKAYLPPAQVWLYNLLANTTAIEHHIGARSFLQHNYYHPAFTFDAASIGTYYNYILKLDKGFFRNKLEHLLLRPQKWIYPTEAQHWTRYIKKHQIQLIHAHFAHFACEHIHWIQQTGLPFVVCFYGYDYEQVPFTRPRFVKQYQQLFKKASAILCEGPHGVETLMKMGCPESKLKIVPLGIDMTEWRTMPVATKQQHTLRLLQIANFTPKKGQLDTIKAAVQAKKNLPNLSLTLLGSPKDEAYFDSCIKLIEQGENKDWISYIPFVAYQKLKKMIWQHDVFIHPSKYTKDRDCEGGAPTILFNIQAMGMPVMSTRHCDIPFVVKDEISGILSEEGNVDALTETMAYFYHLSEKDFRQWQQQTFNWSKTAGDIQRSASSLLGVYEELVH